MTSNFSWCSPNGAIHRQGSLSFHNTVKAIRVLSTMQLGLTVLGLVRFLASVSQLLRWLYVLRLQETHMQLRVAQFETSSCFPFFLSRGFTRLIVHQLICDITLISVLLLLAYFVSIFNEPTIAKATGCGVQSRAS